MTRQTHAVLTAQGGRGAPSLSLQDADLAVRPSEAPLLTQSAKVRWDTLRPETEIRLHKLSCRAHVSECHLPRVLPVPESPSVPSEAMVAHCAHPHSCARERRPGARTWGWGTQGNSLLRPRRLPF